jgi:hypothetical protein
MGRGREGWRKGKKEHLPLSTPPSPFPFSALYPCFSLLSLLFILLAFSHFLFLLMVVNRGRKDVPLAASSPLLHWTLGGPWFKDQRTMGEGLAAEWFAARDAAFRLWD